MIDQSPKIGVLDTRGLWVINPTRTAVHFFDQHGAVDHFSLGTLFALCETWELSELWVHQSWAQASGMWHPTVMEHPFQHVATGWHVKPDPGEMHWWYGGYRPGIHGKYRILCPWLDDDRAFWKECVDGEQLAHALRAYSHALGFDYRTSPGGTGIALLRSLHRESNGHQTQLEIADLPYVAKTNAARDAAWIDMITSGAEPARYIYAFDKNSMYLGACASLPLGMGPCEHITGFGWPWATGPLPGYYCIDQMPDGVKPEYKLLFDPDLFYAKHPQAALWVTAPILRAAIEDGFSPHISECYVWPKQHQVLQSWYKRIRDGRKQLMEARIPLATPGPESAPEIALKNLKRTYTMAIGWLDPRDTHKWGNWTPEGQTLYRPDWRHHIVAEAHARMWRQFVRARQNVCVFAWYIDCFYILSDNDSSVEVAAVAGLPLGSGIGQFKVKGRYLYRDYQQILAPAWSGVPRERTKALQAMIRHMSEQDAGGVSDG